MLYRSLAFAMVEAQMKATKTPHAVISPFRYGESITVSKFFFAATIIRGEKQVRRKKHTMIRSMISLLTTSYHRNVSTWTEYKRLTIVKDNTSYGARASLKPLLGTFLAFRRLFLEGPALVFPALCEVQCGTIFAATSQVAQHLEGLNRLRVPDRTLPVLSSVRQVLRREKRRREVSSGLRARASWANSHPPRS
jgi:hypothetical protein